MATPKIAVYSNTGSPIFDSSLDRVLSFIKNINETVTIPAGGSGLIERVYTFNDPAYVANALILCEFVSTTPPQIVGGYPWSPIIMPLNILICSNGVLTLKVYHYSLGNLTLDVNLLLRVFRK